MLKKILTLALGISLLSGCEIFQTRDVEPISTNDALVCKVPYDFKVPTAINMRDVKFYVITPDKMRSILSGNPENLPIVFYALSVDGYESMSYNMTEINKFLEANKILFREIRQYYSVEPAETEK